jgi:putative hydrolase of the HAD superfamily
MPFMAVRAVIFDWGGTLTPWHSVDLRALWADACAPHFPAGRIAQVAAALHEAEAELWRQAGTAHRSATIDLVFARAGVGMPDGFLPGFLDLWAPHTYTDPDALPLLRALRERGIRIGVLSNTMWPRSAHEDVFARDEVLSLIDGAVYTSEIPWTKPHPEAFRAAMAAVGESEPQACVFVGDRPFDDIYGAKQLGMRAVLLPNSAVPPHDGPAPDAVISRLADLLPHVEAW